MEHRPVPAPPPGPEPPGRCGPAPTARPPWLTPAVWPGNRPWSGISTKKGGRTMGYEELRTAGHHLILEDAPTARPPWLTPAVWPGNRPWSAGFPHKPRIQLADFFVVLGKFCLKPVQWVEKLWKNFWKKLKKLFHFPPRPADRRLPGSDWSAGPEDCPARPLRR